MNRELVKSGLMEIINGLYKEYKLPVLVISDEEWNCFLDVLESHFLAHNLMNDYIHAINIIIRRALNFALLDSSDTFSFNYIIKALCDLSVFKIYEDEIEAMQEELSNLKENRQYHK